MKLRILATATLIAPFCLAAARVEASPSFEPPQILLAQSTWSQLSAKDGSFTVLVPGEATEQTESNTTEGVTTEDHTFTVETDDGAFIVGYSEFVDDISIVKPEALLEAASGGLLQDGGKLLRQRTLSLSGYPGREVEYQSQDGTKSQARLYLVGQRLYQLHAITPRPSDAKKFFDSFQLKKPLTK